ncbi:hypothetical protein QFC21_000911 [Naganishia friedmannii]|uniref:Uncharacterized protein n=1 Tax=Naganishia friedmannii TaxID=89922 RepID=A0ACC2W7N7_9TREE|nr:hypothetical protein QFC21_000911 [Naganishia friedmannii]
MADPYLVYRPSFAYSLPVQILIQGITLTLLAVLLIHLLFTTQYHFPLSRFNYLLQLCGILLVLMNIVISIVCTLRAQNHASKRWPYMLDFISVNLPDYGWTTAETAAWYTLHCVCNGLVQLTHIQFLTLLFPSKTEVQLIFLLLGPLAITASGLVYTSLSDNRTTIDLGDAIRNVFDSTLLLIFSMALFIWGFLVNRKRAWRTDGGTGAFGAGSLALAITSTAVNFVEVREDNINWLQNLLWALVLWQSWLGFWWWVGSGMGIGEVQDIMEREHRRKVRQERRERKRARELDAARQNTASLQDGVQDSGTAISSAIETSNFIGSFARRVTSRAKRQRTAQATADEIEMQPMSSNEREDEGTPASENARQTGRRQNPQHRVRRERTFVTESTSSDASPLPLESVSGVFSYPINAILRYVRYLRSGHEQATKAKVQKRANLRRKVFESGSRRISDNNEPSVADAERGEENSGEQVGRNAAGNALSGSAENVGWGLGSFGIREAAEGERRLTQAQLLIARDQQRELPANQARMSDDSDLDGGDGEREEARKGEESDLNDEGMSDIDVERGEGRPNRFISEITPPTGQRSRSRSPTDSGNIDGVQRVAIEELPPRSTRRRSSAASMIAEPPTDREQADASGEAGGSWYWWKPLRKWRRTDKSVY